MFDLTDPKSFGNLKMWKDKFIENGLGSEDATFPFVVIGNKCDLSSSRKISAEEARQWCKENGDIPYFEASAKENLMISEAFMEMGKSALRRVSRDAIVMPTSIKGAGPTITLGDKSKRTHDYKKAKKKCRC